MRIPSPAAIERAETLLKALRVRAPDEIDVEAIAERAGAIVVPRALSLYEARVLHLNDRALITVEAALLPTPHGRFLVAHELGHWLLHPGMDLLATCKGEDASRGRRYQSELEANDFAASLAMPRALALPYCSSPTPTLADVRTLATVFRVPLESAALRYAELALGACACALVRSGKIAWWLGSASFALRLAKRFPLGAEAHASSLEALRAHEEAGMPARVPAAAWSNKPKARRAELIEHSVSVGVAGEALAWLTPS